jgi:NAD(P)-dependent dehydrogenase (short-subunit alcohol dehydrogenase family)
MSIVNDLFNVRDKIAVLTGGGGVLAGAIGEGLALAGAKVVMLDIKVQNAEKAANVIRNKGGFAIGLGADVLHTDQLENALQDIKKQLSTVDILINLAGGNLPGATIDPEQNVFDLKIDDFEKVLNLNLNGTVYPSLVFGKEMAQNKKGCIINISSMAAYRAITRVVGYSAGKAAVSNFTKWMAMELAMKFGDGLRVNAIAPGFFIGKQNRALLTNDDGSYTDRGKTVIHHTPMKRFGVPEELIGTVIYLASDASKFVTGVVIPVDGGFEAFSGV